MKNRFYLLGIVAIGMLLLSSITNDNVDKRKSSLKAKLDEVASYVSVRNSKNPEVSEAAVAWHMDHMYLMVTQIHKALEQSDESNYESEFNIKRAYVFTFHKIPRGIATAPAAVTPKDTIDINTLQMHFNEALTTVEKFSELPEKKHFNHPVFGNLNRDKTITFLVIHTEHHLKIIRDILKEK